MVALRSVKEACEIEQINLACNIGYEMHVAAMKHALPGQKEQYIAGLIEGIAASYGSMVSFPVILSQNGETLHNHDHSKTLTVGRMMLTDAGAENNMCYCSDFTRTVPVGGRFDQRQKDVYNIVLDCNNKAMSNVPVRASGSLQGFGSRVERPWLDEGRCECRGGCRGSCFVHASRVGSHDGTRRA